MNFSPNKPSDTTQRPDRDPGAAQEVERQGAGAVEAKLKEAQANLLDAEGKLMAFRHDGFWACMDTFKDKQQLDDLYAQGKAPWEVWKTPGGI